MNRFSYSVAAWRAATQRPGFDVIFCGHLLMVPLAAALARLIGAKLWLQVHGIDAWAMPKPLVRWGAEMADLVTSVSRYTRSEMMRWWRGDPTRLRVLSNTFGDQFQPGPKPAHLVSRYGVAGRKVIMTVSRISSADRYKGHDRLIEALPAIRERHPDAAYLVVGTGDGEARLRALVLDSHQAEHVVFAGHVPAGELPDHYRLADVFVMPSTKEGFGIVFLEAAASGVSVVGGNVDGSWDALREGAIGPAIDPNDISKMATAVSDMLSNPRPADRRLVEVFGHRPFASHVAALADGLLSESASQC